ncbi:MAG: nickel pincer cofactor biosynthesis protein LarC [bacterium]|nr:nickel pincer cofactor biosynthesis protein LarC [bacterium]
MAENSGPPGTARVFMTAPTNSQPRRIAYLDCPAGICGSMLLGALLDAGVDEAELLKGLHGLRISEQGSFRPAYRPDFRLERETVLEHGIGATRIRVQTHEDHPHRNLRDIEKIINQSELPPVVQSQSIAVFRRLAEAEAKIHRVTLDTIHFHEVGAIDAIIDIVGCVLGLHLLGVERIYASPVNTGAGFVRCAHGLMPVPAPATAELLKSYPTYSPEIPDSEGVKQRIEKELTTPTGAALLSGLSDPEDFGGQPAMTVETIGYGAGEHRLPIPNLLRISIGRPAAAKQIESLASTADSFASDRVLSLECTLDDANPEWIGYLFESLYAAGAFEVYLSPVHTKKNRPATVCSLLCALDRENEILEILFRESTTLGVRRRVVERRKLERELRQVETEFGTVTIKLGVHQGRIYNVAPEYESCRLLAQQTQKPLKDIYSAAARAAKSISMPESM